MKKIMTVLLLGALSTVTFARDANTFVREEHHGKKSQHQMGDSCCMTEHDGMPMHDRKNDDKNNHNRGSSRDNTRSQRNELSTQQLSMEQQNQIRDIETKYLKNRQLIDQKYGDQEIDLATERNKLDIQLEYTPENTDQTQLMVKREDLRIKARELHIQKRNEIRELSLSRDKEINQIIVQ
ncbi:MAG: hypothetical protein ACRCWI_04550 [Brevinema sp.]